MTDDTKAGKSRQRKLRGPFPDEFMDQLLAQVRGRDAESNPTSYMIFARLKIQ